MEETEQVFLELKGRSLGRLSTKLSTVEATFSQYASIHSVDVVTFKGEVVGINLNINTAD